MSDTESQARSHDDTANEPQKTDFDVLLGKAERLLNNSELDAALEQLLALQERYVAATRLFDLIGEAYMRGLDFKQGIRYKTLHEVLSGTLSAQKLSRPRAGARPRQVGEGESEEEPSGYVAAPGSPPATHVTTSMGQELLRQGHYEKALEIFDVLLEQKPEDECLAEAREGARKKLRERRLMRVLERWLNNIEHIKTGRTTDHD